MWDATSPSYIVGRHHRRPSQYVVLDERALIAEDMETSSSAGIVVAKLNATKSVAAAQNNLVAASPPADVIVMAPVGNAPALHAAFSTDRRRRRMVSQCSAKTFHTEGRCGGADVGFARCEEGFYCSQYG